MVEGALPNLNKYNQLLRIVSGVQFLQNFPAQLQVPLQFLQLNADLT